eukprot:TRINITY_DN24007_c0_g1_i1.p1 TRINITY_DN24007_c0_g1~~TRINITY_DN24007_c0_g1_i1.p1  ORF type:complete len:670 (-),score=154.45 TRINITY_DN24007_c0_g1_i1:36-1979(-)
MNVTDDVKRITQRVMEIFSKEYLRAYKYILIRDAKRKRKEQKVKPTIEWDVEPRPRGKNRYHREVKMELKLKIVSWTQFDTDVDPYVAYIVESSFGERTASVYRRYNSFKDLVNKMSKVLPQLKTHFPQAKTFEGRKFEWDYLNNRKASLQKCLDCIAEAKDLHNDPYLIKWCGLTVPEDPQLVEIFDLAVTNTKWRLWIWKRIPYDDEEEAIAKLVIEEISRELYYNLTSGVPGFARSSFMSGIYKVITSTVGPLVAAGWKAAKEAVKPIQPKIKDVIETGIEKLLDVEDEIKRNLTKAISEGLAPIFEQLNPALKSMAEQGVNPAMTLAGEIIPYYSNFYKIFESVLDKPDEKQVEQIEKFIKDVRGEAEKKVNDIIQKSLETILGDLAKHVTLDALSTLFSPIKRLVDLVNNSFDLFLNPTPHVRCIQTMCEYISKLEQLDPSSENFREQVDDILDQEESWLIWRRWWVYWEYRWKAWSIYYFSWGIPDLASVAYVIRDHSLEYSKIQKKWIKRWAFRFGDHLHHKAKGATKENWHQLINESFRMSFYEANREMRRKVSHLFESLIKLFFYGAVGVKVQDFLMKSLAPVVDGLGKTIPAPINEVLDIVTITNDAIEDALTHHLNQSVEECFVETYQKAWERLGD